jgi:cephalosporin hydroxylase
MKKIVSSLFMLLIFTASLHADARTDELKKQVCLILPSLEGWCSREKALAFIDLILQEKPKMCVEIGVFGGASLFPVASALKYHGEGVVIGIDPWDKLECIKYLDPREDEAHFKWWSHLDLQSIYHSYTSMLKRYQLEGYCKTVATTSEKAAMGLNSIDILHLDGNHSNIASVQDVTLYLPKVRSGGYIWLNDCLWEEMQDSVELLLNSCEVVKLVDHGNCILFRKK